MRKPFLILAATLAAAAPARAQYHGGGLLEWSLDDVTVRAPNGRRHSSAVNQTYRYGADGPLGTPLIGEGQGAVSLFKGKSLAQSVNGADANQEILGYSLSASLLPPLLRRFFTLAPSLSRTKTSQVWGSPAVPRDLVEDSRGLLLGLTLPRLPSFSVSRTRLSRKDLSSAPSVDQRTDLQTEQSSYFLGPMRANYRHDTTRVDDALSASGRARTASTSADWELNMPELKTGGVRSAFWRNSYQTQRTDHAASSTLQESYASDVYLTSRHFESARGEHYLAYAGGYSHSLGQPRDAVSDSLTLSSSGRLRRGRVDNQLFYRRSDGRSRQDNVGDGATLDWRSPSGKTGYRLDGGGGWSWDRAASGSLTDSLRQRVSHAPRPAFDGYAELATNGATPLAGRSGGFRQNALAAGLGLHESPYADLFCNYNLSRSRNLAMGLVTVTNSVTAGAQSSPIEELKLGLSYSSNWSRTSAGGSTRSSLVTASLFYAPFEGFQASGELSASARAVNSALEAGYTIGMTRLALRWERVELYTVNAYSRLSATLSRRL